MPLLTTQYPSGIEIVKYTCYNEIDCEVSRVMQDYALLSKDIVVANIIDGKIEPIVPERLPLFLQRTGDVEAWMASRAIDSHRTNSRLLKRALRLEKKDDIATVLTVNAATITDDYWVKPIEDTETSYADIRFTVNRFDDLALTGDVNSFDQPFSRTPELTNTGSFEKCWRLKDGVWWMVKAGSDAELFSELLIYHIGKLLGFPMAEYQPDSAFIQSRNFTDGATVNFEPAASVIGDESDYVKIYEVLKPFGKTICDAYVQQCYLDALVLNMDRHEHNFGLLRDSATGAVLALAPLFDHNIALVSRGYPKNITAENDRLIEDFSVLLAHVNEPISVRKLMGKDVDGCIAQVPWNPPATDDVLAPKRFVVDYILNRQTRLAEQNKGLLIFETGR